MRLSERQHNQRRTNWEEVFSRLEKAQQAVQDADRQDAAMQRDILHERASLLANAPASGALQEQLGVQSLQSRFLTFTIGGEHHAFEAAFVTRVVKSASITLLPGLPAHVLGIMAVEGNVVSVVDLRLLLQMPVTALSNQAAVIVLGNGTNEFGIIVDEILGMESYAEEAVQPAPVHEKESFLLGIVEGNIGIMDATKLLNDQRLIIDAS
jgi:purine-binding chemotaxis protein CheW